MCKCDDAGKRGDGGRKEEEEKGREEEEAANGGMQERRPIFKRLFFQAWKSPSSIKQLVCTSAFFKKCNLQVFFHEFDACNKCANLRNCRNSFSCVGIFPPSLFGLCLHHLGSRPTPPGRHGGEYKLDFPLFSAPFFLAPRSRLGKQKKLFSLFFRAFFFSKADFPLLSYV